ncbi:hypothetical protein N8293_00265 [Gammaproteobacteria bacterium]|nr:hypothetical protein [Gammaproteobacteria bacterium]
MKFAKNNNYINNEIDFVKTNVTEATKRLHFTKAQQTKVRKALTDKRANKSKNKTTNEIAELLYDYYFLLLHSAIRVGYTFKVNCEDTRNTKVKSLIFSLIELGLKVSLWDPLLSCDNQEKLRNEGVDVYDSEPKDLQLALVCVYHDQIIKFLERYDGIIYDYKNIDLN